MATRDTEEALARAFGVAVTARALARVAASRRIGTDRSLGGGALVVVTLVVVALVVEIMSVVLGDDVVVKIAATGNAVASITAPTTPNATDPETTWRRWGLREAPEFSRSADDCPASALSTTFCPCVNFFMGTSVKNEKHTCPYEFKTCSQFTRVAYVKRCNVGSYLRRINTTQLEFRDATARSS